MKTKRTMVPVGAEETLIDLIEELTGMLEDLQQSEEKGELKQYGEGSKAAFVYVLEFIQQRWEQSEEQGLNFDIEKTFPV